jgi:serine/threonine protein kinase
MATADHPQQLGKYEILSVLGRGGMGVVYKARDPVIDRIVAIKTISSHDDSLDQPQLQRLLMEARSAGRLHHPNIVTVFDFGEDKGISYIVQEYAEGVDLAHVIALKQPLSLPARIDILLQVCAGLAYAHDAGVMHRDMKPANVRLTSSGVAKLLDFGLARYDDTQITKTGFISGTIAYMSPERLAGSTGKSDDIFALGAVAYELLTYTRAFGGDSAPQVMFQVVSVTPPAPSTIAELPPLLDAVVLKCLSRDVESRFASADDFAAALEYAMTQPEVVEFLESNERSETFRSAMATWSTRKRRRETQAVMRGSASADRTTMITSMPTAEARPTVNDAAAVTAMQRPSFMGKTAVEAATLADATVVIPASPLPRKHTGAIVSAIVVTIAAIGGVFYSRHDSIPPPVVPQTSTSTTMGSSVSVTAASSAPAAPAVAPMTTSTALAAARVERARIAWQRLSAEVRSKLESAREQGVLVSEPHSRALLAKLESLQKQADAGDDTNVEDEGQRLLVETDRVIRQDQARTSAHASRPGPAIAVKGAGGAGTTTTTPVRPRDIAPATPPVSDVSHPPTPAPQPLPIQPAVQPSSQPTVQPGVQPASQSPAAARGEVAALLRATAAAYSGHDVAFFRENYLRFSDKVGAAIRNSPSTRVQFDVGQIELVDPTHAEALVERTDQLPGGSNGKQRLRYYLEKQNGSWKIARFEGM